MFEKDLEKTLEEIYKAEMKKDLNIENQYNEYLNWLYFDNKDKGLEKLDLVRFYSINLENISKRL